MLYSLRCCAMLCYAMLCCAVLCYAMLCYAVLCCAMHQVFEDMLSDLSEQQRRVLLCAVKSISNYLHHRNEVVST
jgi:hypothetical protein